MRGLGGRGVKGGREEGVKGGMGKRRTIGDTCRRVMLGLGGLGLVLVVLGLLVMDR